MQFTREIRRLLAGLLISFLIIVLAAAYWGVSGPDTLLLRDDNPRLFEAQASIVRGDIVDRNGKPLVTSVQNPSGRVTRDFMYPAMNSILGYYSLRYGVGGAEAAYNPTLRGDSLPQSLNTVFALDMLHLPQVGANVQLSLDLSIQQTVYDALQGYKGAAVVLDVATGEVLALVSLPTFDPNTLDADWQSLVASSERPFFNRALQGRYQPGGILETPLMTAALIAGLPVDVPTEGASQPVSLNGLTLGCARNPPADKLALIESYAFACPAPFVDLYNLLGAAKIQETFDLFQLGKSYRLPDFVDTLPTPQATVTPLPVAEQNLTLENVLGQGQLTLSPLDVAVMTAAIVNEGNAPQPNILKATRAPDTAQWQPVNVLYPTVPITTAETSRRVQEMMRSATISGAATRAARTGMNIGGHAAIAYSGETTHVWFTGFVITGARQGIAVAIVLEDNDNPSDAAVIGGQILEAAYNSRVVTTAP